jgi:hypothetical protein
MPSVQLPAPSGASAEPYATAEDVRTILGPIGNRLPAWVNVTEFLGMAHAQLVDDLAKVYPDEIPTFAANGLSAVRWAEAKLAAAEILDAIRVTLGSDADDSAADSLRASARATISDGIVGYAPGAYDVEGTIETATARPLVSSETSLSAFPDPYEAAREDGVRFL